jgi:hypothetical protein
VDVDVPDRVGGAVKALQFSGRVALAVVACAVLAMIGLQFARAVHENVVLASELGSLRSDVAGLRLREVAQERTIRRLNDPAGAVPEIHDRLRLTRPDEAIIYVKQTGQPTAAPQP